MGAATIRQEWSTIRDILHRVLELHLRLLHEPDITREFAGARQQSLVERLSRYLPEAWTEKAHVTPAVNQTRMAELHQMLRHEAYEFLVMSGRWNWRPAYSLGEIAFRLVHDLPVGLEPLFPESVVEAVEQISQASLAPECTLPSHVRRAKRPAPENEDENLVLSQEEINQLLAAVSTSSRPAHRTSEPVDDVDDVDDAEEFAELEELDEVPVDLEELDLVAETD